MNRRDGTKGIGKQAGSLRIIGGAWRGRKLSFPGLQGLRPTGDRIRETVFNWLMPRLVGARCLDMFAGSGAMGLEALSRGAARCDFLDLQPEATDSLGRHLHTLEATDRGRVFTANALQWQSSKPYDIVFIDPPYSADLFEPALNHLEGTGLLAKEAQVYLEFPRGGTVPDAGFGFQCLRDKTAGGVRFQLLEVV